MDVANSTATAANASLNNTQPAAARNERQVEQQQQAKQADSTVVKLSDQAQQLQRAEAQSNVENQNKQNAENQQRANTENQNRANAENQQRANAENQQRANAEAQRNEARQRSQPSGISFVSGENKGGRIKTSA